LRIDYHWQISDKQNIKLFAQANISHAPDHQEVIAYILGGFAAGDGYR
jgi:hypothetical protein